MPISEPRLDLGRASRMGTLPVDSVLFQIRSPNFKKQHDQSRHIVIIDAPPA